MNRIITCFFFLAFSSSVSAQENTSTLRIKGISKISVKPTRTVVSFSISSIQPTYAGSVEDLVKRVDLLTKVLKDLNYKDEDIVTSNFSVNKNTYFERGTRKDSGFVASQSLQIDFEQNKEKLLKVLNESTSSKANPGISLKFTLDDSKKIKIQSELIKLAVKDAHEKAKTICEASNYELLDIQDIAYGVGNNNYSSEIFSIVEVPDEMELELDIDITNYETTNLTFNDSVVIIFNIQKK
jgi:uncharacterized protein YggE